MKKIEINKSSIKKSLLAGALALTMGGLTGCSTNDKKPENNGNENKVVETKPNELTAEETKVLKPGDIIPAGKEVNRELLEQQGMDYLYVYERYTRFDDGEIVENSNRVVKTYKERPAEKKLDYTLQHNDGFEYATNVYTLKNYEIVSVDFVKAEDGTYKKQVTHEDGRVEFAEVIDENNIDKDKVKTLK